MKKYDIDASLFTSRGEAHEIMKKIFSDCEYYGSSLDALHDVLTSIMHDCVITVRNLGKSREHIDTYADRLRNVFCDSAEENRHLTVTFTED